MREFAKQELQRQDFVDNEVFELLERLAPADAHLQWDIELIGFIRAAIGRQLVERRMIRANQFYPYRDIQTEPRNDKV